MKIIKLITTFVLIAFYFGISFGQNFNKSLKYTIPNSFKDFKLGMKKTGFLSKYPNAKKGTFWVLFNDISAEDMEVYTLEKQTTDSGDKIDIDLCFHNGILSLISIEYKDWQFGKDLVEALNSKYGHYTRYDDRTIIDPLNREERTTQNFYWERSNCCILNLNYTIQLHLTHLLFADKSVQQKLRNLKLKQNIKKIE